MSYHFPPFGKPFACFGTASANPSAKIMNDPGLDNPIQDGADTVEKQREEQAEETEEALAYLNPRLGRQWP